MPNITRGGKLPGFMNYLVGPGRFNEHENPHIVAADDTVLALVGTDKQPLDVDDALDIANILERPRKMHDVSVTRPVKEYDERLGKRVEVGRRDAHMWQCSLALNGEVEGPLTDAAWNRIAQEFVTRMGFIDEDRAKTSRWVAVRHGLNHKTGEQAGNDHIHIVVQMVTEDGSKASVHNDMKRSQEVCRDLEREFGLARTEGAHAHQTLGQEKRGERERAARENAPWVEKQELRRRLRGALASSQTEAQFVQRAFSAGVAIRPRFATGSTDRVVGYSVAIPPPDHSDRKPIWYAPSKLDKNLGLPAVRRALDAPPAGDPQAVAAWQEHHTGMVPTTRLVRPVTSDLRERAFTGTADHADLSRIFAAASLKYEADSPGPLAQASEHLGQVALTPASAGYAARLQQRAGSRDAAQGWYALIIESGRLSRLMAQENFDGKRPMLAQQHGDVITPVIDHAEMKISSQQRRNAAARHERTRLDEMGISEGDAAQIHRRVSMPAPTQTAEAGGVPPARPATPPRTLPITPDKTQER